MGDSSSRARAQAPTRVLKYVAQPYSFTMMDRGMPALAAPADTHTCFECIFANTHLEQRGAV